MSTNFFDQQDVARRQTGRLVFLFGGAVALIVLTIYAAVTFVAVAGTKRKPDEPQPGVVSPVRFGIVATAVLVVVSGGSLYKTAVLREGGEAVARMLGGRPLNPSTSDLAERRLLHVVEEMALASGTPVPPVFVLDDEPAINAFAAGFTPGDAVIGVSRGCLNHLTRDELQGVIGHEFSHILNGDMRLNLRLIGLVHGILVLALIGQLMMRVAPDTSREKDSAGIALGLLVSGLCLYVTGWLGVFLGRVIKAAISRQREYLADASSVQFTRNPEGIAGALKKIGGLQTGSRLQSPNAEQASHLFFGPGVSYLTNLLATHPPLGERIRRLDPSFQGPFERVDPRGHVAVEPDEAPPGVAGFATSARPARPRPAETPLDPDAAIASVGRPTQAHVDYAADLLTGLPRPLADATREPFTARAVVYALLLDADGSVRHAQLDLLDRRAEPGTVREVLRLRPLANALGAEARLPLVDLTFPALRRLSPAQYQVFRGLVDALVKADRRVSLFEYALLRMLLRHLDRGFFPSSPPAVRFHTLDPLFDDCLVLLGSLALLGQHEGAGSDRAFAAGVTRLQSRYPGERSVTMPPAERCTLGGVERALDRLALAAPAVKRRVLDACAACIACDGVVTLGEAELLRAIADSLDCPMPPVLAPPPQ